MSYINWKKYAASISDKVWKESNTNKRIEYAKEDLRSAGVANNLVENLTIGQLQSAWTHVPKEQQDIYLAARNLKGGRRKGWLKFPCAPKSVLCILYLIAMACLSPYCMALQIQLLCHDLSLLQGIHLFFFFFSFFFFFNPKQLQQTLVQQMTLVWQVAWVV